MINTCRVSVPQQEKKCCMIFRFLRLCLDEQTCCQVPVTTAVVCAGVCSYSSMGTCAIVRAEVVGITQANSTLRVAEFQSSSWGVKGALSFPKIYLVLTHLFPNEASASIHAASPPVKPSCCSSETSHWLLPQEPAASYRIMAGAQSSRQSLRGGGRQGKPRFFGNKFILRRSFLWSFYTVSSATGLVQLKQQTISCQKHHLLGKGIISFEASYSGSSVQLSDCFCYN